MVEAAAAHAATATTTTARATTTEEEEREEEVMEEEMRLRRRRRIYLIWPSMRIRGLLSSLGAGGKVSLCFRYFGSGDALNGWE